MTSISLERFHELSGNVKAARIAVIGDIMLDRYLWGSVNRISPEAPVPVVDIEQESNRLGGAANVAGNVEALGAVPILIGVVGDDASGKIIRSLVEEKNFRTDGLIVDEERPSTVKTRVIAHVQQVVRTDRESRNGISKTVLDKACAVVEKLLPSLDGIILQDYNKGFLIPELIHFICEEALKHNKIVAVDPKFANFFEYRGVTIFKPNQREIESVLGQRFRTDEEIIQAGLEVCKQLYCGNLLITRGEKGMTLFENCGNITHIPTRAKEVHDVSGAGDTVISTLTAYMIGRAPVREAAVLANYAAGVVCGEVGVAAISLKKLERAIAADSIESGLIV